MPGPAIHEDLSREVRAEGMSDRSTGFWIFGFFTAAAFLPMAFHHPPRLWAVPVAIVTLLLTLGVPRALHPVNLGLTRLGLLMARVTNPVVMAVLFYVIFTPIAAMMRVMGKDPLNMRFDPNASSYWKPRVPPGPPGETIANPF